MNDIFQRSELIFGNEKMKKLSEKKVIIFGIGGVGSWCAESLIRTGIVNLTIVDFDKVCMSNINRQLHATTQTVGELKTLVLKKRLLEINPTANILELTKIYSSENFHEFEIEKYDYVIDAIDSLGNKIHLMETVANTNAKLFSSMGAALKIDPTRIKVDYFSKVQGCPMARRLRKLIRKHKHNVGDFFCVYSDELLENLRNDAQPEFTELIENKKIINGSLVHITAIYGFTLAGLVMKDIYFE